MMIEMSAKYAAAIQGAVNCADNLTLYALSATLNGLFLDSGGCRPLPLSADIAEEKVEEQAGECVGFLCLLCLLTRLGLLLPSTSCRSHRFIAAV